MKNFIFLCFNVLLIFLNFLIKYINCVIIYPEIYKEEDLFFYNIEDGIVDNDRIYFVAAKYFTNNNINTYIKKQGFNLLKDTTIIHSLINSDINFYDSEKSDYKEIYSNGINTNSLIYQLPVSEIKNEEYILFHRFYISSNTNIKISLSFSNDGNTFTLDYIINDINYSLVTIKIKTIKIKWLGSEYRVYINNYEAGTVSSIKFIKIFTQDSNTFNIAMHWTFLYIPESDDNTPGIYTYNGINICNIDTNPCVEGYMCKGGRCVKCDDSCFSCIAPNSNSDCGNECSVIATTATSKSGKCDIGYVDLSKFGDITINKVAPPRTNRMTYSFWFFAQKDSDERKTISTQFLKIIFDTNIICKTFFRYDDKDFDKDEIEEDDVRANQEMNDEMYNKWVYIKCGYSKDHDTKIKLFMQIYYKGKIRYQPEVIFNASYNTKDYNHYKYFFREHELVTLNFFGFSNFKHFYMKSFYIFKEYLPEPYDIKYFQLEKFVEPNTYGELIFALPLDLLERKTDHYSVKYYSYDTSISIYELKLYLADNKDSNFKPPRNFQRLNLLTEPNTQFRSNDLNEISSISLNGYDYYKSNDENAFSCNINSFLNFEETTDPGTINTLCRNDCPSTFSMIHGINNNKGICNYDCNKFESNCLYIQTQLLTLKDNFKCNTNYYNLFYRCEEEDKNKYFYYNFYYKPGNIILDLSSYNLNSYFIEFYIYFDKKYSQPEGIEKYYYFYLNSIQIFANNTGKFLNDDNKLLPFNEKEWNYVIINVIYDPKESPLKKTKIELYINNIQSIVSSRNLERKIPLQKIYFCYHDAGTCDGNDLQWGSAFYQKLRVWDGNKAQPSIIERYDEFFIKGDINKISSLLLYLPLTNNKIADNKLTDYFNSDFYYDVRFSYNKWNFPQYNYASDFNNSECNDSPNCEICSIGGPCYKCKNGYILSNGECKIPTQKFLRLPGILPDSITLSANDYQPKNAYTIYFWIKFFGFFSSVEGTIINLSNNLKIIFNPIEGSDSTGLNLVFYTGGKPIILSNYYYFRNYIGKWALISLSHYNTNEEEYYPSMTRFEVMDKYCPLIPEIAYNLSLSPITLNNDIYALFYNITIYSTFLVGAYKYEQKFLNNISPLIPLSFLNNCDDSIYNCQNDFPPSISIASCDSLCDNECYISGRYDKCACTHDNDASKLFLGNYSQFYCTKSDYINFAGINTVNSVSTAHDSHAFTINFWVYANNYVNKKFGGFKVEWEGHATIKVEKDNDDQYYFICTSNTNVNLNLTFFVGEWNYLHCSIDYPNTYHYISTFLNSLSSKFQIVELLPGLVAANTNLNIEDLSNDKNWGVLFFQYIRLWTQEIPSASFIAKIKINDYNKFPQLVHEWNCTHNTNKKCSDTKSSINFIQIPSTLNIFSNYLPEDSYTKLDFCTEQGTYYDIKTGECVKFISLTNIYNDDNDDIKITDVEPSYNHNYGISFWTLLEAPQNIIYDNDEKGLLIDWSYHMKIALIYESTELNAYCFPQNYPKYSEILNIFDKDNNIYSKKNEIVLNSIVDSLGNMAGKWIWIQCSLSYYNRKFYLNQLEKVLKSEAVYNEVENDQPLGWFFGGINKNDKSTLTIHIPKNTNSKIYFRALYLFKDYIPNNFNYKYMDMSLISNSNYIPLSLAINFANYEISSNTIKLTYYSYKNNLKGTLHLTLNLINPDDLELSANFIFLPLCNIENSEKYNSIINLCERINDCDLISLNALYCMGENLPLACKDNYFLNIYSDGLTECKNNCEENLRTPGSPINMGICNADCLSNDELYNCPHNLNDLQNYESSFECVNNYYRVDYHCYKTINDDFIETKGALFYSRCNHPFNFFYEFKDFLSKINYSYIIEIWFMIDNVICKWDDTPLYIFYAAPHYIYRKKVGSQIKYYYKYSSTLENELKLIHNYEWNKIVIFADNNKKKITVYQNFELKSSNIITINLSSGLPRTLTLVFCSVNGADLLGCKASIKFGSVYYNNFRIWDINLATIETIQAFNRETYTNIPDNLLLNYPLTLGYIDNNVLIDSIGKYVQNININNILNNNEFYKTEIYHKDKIIIYNYSTKFDWGKINEGSFVKTISETGEVESGNCDSNCIRCYIESDITRCYECKSDHILYGQKCIKTEKYYLKTPSTSSGEYSFITSTSSSDISRLTSFTLTFWIKFYGVLKDINTQNPKIISLTPTTYLAFKRQDRSLLLLQNSKVAFNDLKFPEYIAKWIPIQIASYISSGTYDIYPHMFTLIINNIDIPFQTDYSIPNTGIILSQINLGSEIIALFNNIRIYTKFYQGAYGKIMSNNYNTGKNTDLFINFELSSVNIDECVKNEELSSSIPIICVNDYSPYFEENDCNNDDNKIIKVEYDENNGDYVSSCNNCEEYCTEFCYDKGNEKCTCDMTRGVFWLRRNTYSQTFCEKIPYIDFSNVKPITINNVPFTETYEYTLEFWLFIYSYNLITNNFKRITLEWNFHNKLIIYYDGVLKVQCIPIYDSTNTKSDKYPDSSTQSLTIYKWHHIKCGTDLLKSKYFLMSTQNDLKAKKINFPNYEAILSDRALEIYKFFKIYRSDNSYTNFGYIFIREIKLWQQYNFKYLDSKYFDFNLGIEEIKETFPGLLWYFKNLYQDIDSRLVLIEELSNAETSLIYMSDYVGYNIVDPKNEGKTSLLTLCPSTQIYSEENVRCEDKASTDDWNTFADGNNNCLICRNNNYLYVNDGSCVEECPVTYFGNDKIKQCRECHETCYKCTDRFYNNCTACTGSLYYNYKDNTCIENCESVGLTKSNTRPNICVVFDAEASLVNVDTVTPIDVNTFNYIQATVLGATETGYTTYWRFNVSETNRINTELGYDDILNGDATPFTGDLTELSTTLDNTFFKIGHKYVFELDIIKENNGNIVSVTISWILTMNQAPLYGYIKVIPKIGLLQSTTFVMTCYNYSDENTNYELLEYFFYYIEDDTSTIINISQDWSTNNEIYSNFSVRFYQQATTQLNIYCKVRDQFNAESITSTKVKIVNHIDDEENYILTEVLDNYDLNTHISDLQYFSRSEFLKSVTVNPYRDLRPNQYYSTFETSLDGSKILLNDPNCVDNYCNNHGECGIIDVSISCDCKAAYIGNNCNILKTAYSKLAYYFQEMYGRVFQDDIFFTRYLVQFVNYLKENAVDYIIQSNSYIDKLFDYVDFYFNYFYIKLNKQKLSNQLSSGTPFRNYTLLMSQQKNYESAFKEYTNMIEDITIFLIKNGVQNYEFESLHIHYYLIQLRETFNDTEFYINNNFLKNYKSYILFMDCLLSKQLAFNYYLNLIEYKQYPYSWDSSYYPNMTSTFLTIKIYKSNGNEYELKECESTKPIFLYFSFSSYNWLDYINKQKFLFDPNNYKLPNDPIFKDPIYINKSGAVLNDTVEQRIEKYSRDYNLTGIYYTPNEKNIYSTNGISFFNFTSDTDYIIFKSTHLSSFTSMLIPNKMEFVVDGRFFYLKKYILFKWKDNYFKNPGFLSISIILFLYLFTCFVCYCNDKDYYDKIEELDFLKREIVKVHFPYKQNDKSINEIIPNFKPEEKNINEIKHMFDNVNFETESDKIHDEIATGNILTEIPKNPPYKNKKNKKKKIESVSSENEEEEIENEEEENQSGSDVYAKKKRKSIMSKEKIYSNKTKKLNFFLNNDKSKPNYISLKQFHNIETETNNNLPDDLTNEKQEKLKALEAYTNLKLSAKEFVKWNISSRHTLFGPLLNRSLFNPRWKKFTLLLTQILINMMLIAIFLTIKENIRGKNFGKCLFLSILISIISNLFIYLIAFFFITSVYQRRRLYQLVMKGGQLIIIKAYNKLRSENKCSSIIGFIICIIIWIICSYITFTFVAVWKIQKNAWIVTFILSLFIDLLFGELGVEIFIGILFYFRKKANWIRDYGEWLHRLRCYRTLWP